MAWQCEHCNAVNDRDAAVCHQCGAPAAPASDRATSPPAPSTATLAATLVQPGEAPGAVKSAAAPSSPAGQALVPAPNMALQPGGTRETRMGSSLGPPIPWVSPEVEAGVAAPRVEISPRGKARSEALRSSVIGLALVALLVEYAPLASQSWVSLIIFMVLTTLAAGIPLVSVLRHWRTLFYDVDPVIAGSGGWLAPLNLEGQRLLAERGRAVRGEVVSRRALPQPFPHQPWQVYLITYRFTDGNNIRRTGRFRVLRAQAAGLETGRPLTVMYDPDQPTRNAPYGALAFRLTE